MKTQKTKWRKMANKLIFEFMGESTVPWDDVQKSGWTFKWKDLKYDTSWDWLMPVVEKITSKKGIVFNIYFGIDYVHIIVYDEDNSHKFEIQEAIIDHYDRKGNILEATYKAIIEFIRWYNDT